MSQIPAQNITPTTAMVAGSFTNGTYIRIFYQRSEWTLGACYSDNSGTTWGSEILVKDASIVKKNTPLSLVLFTWSGNYTSRIFFLGPDNRIRWFGVKGGNKSDGELLLKNGSPVYAAPYSKLASFVWTENNTPHVRVAYQRSDNTIAQLNWDGSDDFKFTAGDASPATAEGTYLAFVNQAPSNTAQYFRGYYEHSTNQIMELVNEPSQGYIGTMINGQNTIPPNAVIAASVVPASNPKLGRISVLWQNAQAGITQCIFNGTWQTPQALPNVDLHPGGAFATMSYLRDNNNNPGSIQERLVWMGKDASLYHKIL